MRIKLTVGELKRLNSYPDSFRETGFNAFLTTIRCRVDDDTGEVDLDDEDLAKITRYNHQGHKRKLQTIFKRPMGKRFDWDY
jgi:hypothetical protein